MLQRVVRHSALEFLAQVVPMCVIGAFEHELVLAESRYFQIVFRKSGLDTSRFSLVNPDMSRFTSSNPDMSRFALVQIRTCPDFGFLFNFVRVAL